MAKEKKCTVKICEDYVLHDQEEVQKILKRVSDIIGKSYIRQMNEKGKPSKVVTV